ncbi:YqeG family HAD IIIA-type phosphatase [Lacticaseibacillus daqingensis]|uniref:YqeG family HAD IIIA-type phosphatase n=1 Tax=Lacticaseibacillus daqingensis TaxID=2486014 RepID=UPI001CDC703D|nr:YqeG family HAD IIIA-type phosphatase [Lacticaseibacillus daqingensis]
MSVFTPTWLVTAIYTLTPTTLKRHGIQAVLCDLDNTLIAWNNPDGTPALKAWLETMQNAGITVMVVSNNNHDRVARALRQLDLPFVSRALKPLPVGIDRAVRQLDLPKTAVVMVGDQVLTDILAARTAGVRSILVRPLIESDAWNTRITRFFERIVMRAMKPLHYQEDLND